MNKFLFTKQSHAPPCRKKYLRKKTTDLCTSPHDNAPFPAANHGFDTPSLHRKITRSEGKTYFHRSENSKHNLNLRKHNLNFAKFNLNFEFSPQCIFLLPPKRLKSGFGVAAESVRRKENRRPSEREEDTYSMI